MSGTARPTINAVIGRLDKRKTLVVLVRRGEAAQYIPIKP